MALRQPGVRPGAFTTRVWENVRVMWAAQQSTSQTPCWTTKVSGAPSRGSREGSSHPLLLRTQCLGRACHVLQAALTAALGPTVDASPEMPSLILVGWWRFAPVDTGVLPGPPQLV